MSTFFNNLEQPFNLLDEYAFEANRRGEITVIQQKQFTSMMGWKRIVLLVIATIILGSIFGFALFPVLLGGKWYRDSVPVLFIGAIFLAVMIFMGVGIFRQLYRNMKIQRDLANRAIRQGQGQLAHGKKGYTFEMGGSHLRMPADQASGLLPGTIYQVYYLEESGILLSAAANHQANTNQARTALNEILASANRFSADDLLANKNGEVTIAQRRKLFPNILLGVGILLGSLLFLIPFVFMPISTRLTESLSAIFCIILVIAILPLIGGVLLIKALLDVVSPQLKQVQGLVMKERRVVNTGKSSHVEYNYVINNLRFHVNYRAYTALVDGLQYRIYYLSHTKKMIAIEALDDVPGNGFFAPKI